MILTSFMIAINYPNKQTIYEYVNSFFENNMAIKSKVKNNLKHYADGILSAHKKSMRGIKRASNLKIHTSNIARSLKKFLKTLEKTKLALYNRVDKFMDRRCNYYISVDDTNVEKFGKKVFGTAYQRDNTKNAIIHCNTLVDCNITTKKGDLFVSGYSLSPKKVF